MRSVSATADIRLGTRRNRRRLHVGPALALLLCACASSQPQDDVPAIIVGPSPASLADVQAAVTQALGISDVTIASDALTSENTLIIERSRATDPSRQLSGRELGKPELFTLVKSGNRCVLIRMSNAMRQVLPHTSCRRI